MNSTLSNDGSGASGPDETSLRQTPLTEFKKFQQLPLEIRRAIWRACFPPPRIIDLIFHIYDCQPPVTLRINHESRLETLRHYHYLEITTSPREHRCCINFARDLFFTEIAIPLGYSISDNRYSMNVLNEIKKKSPTILGSVTKLVADVRYWDYEMGIYLEAVQLESTLIPCFPNLDTIILVGFHDDAEGDAHVVPEYMKHFGDYYEALRRGGPDVKIPRVIYRKHTDALEPWHWDDPQDPATS